ncbi:hypothetical protein [Nocardia sp. NPDC052566]|uniref:hypothetical protein n=1 Tax=Nocardia sp. NPDC052566 TaxID=3364330 RepID=UPI0037C96403
MADKIGGVATWSFTRIGGLGAFGFALIIVVANLILVPAGMPQVGAGIDEVNTFFTTKAGAAELSSAFPPVAWVCLVVFGAAAVATLWPRERTTGSAWCLVGFAGALLQTGTFVIVVAARLAMSTTTDHSSTGTAGIWAMHDALFTLNGTFLALAMLGFSVAGLRTGLIRPWHAILGLICAAGQLVSSILTPLVIDHAGPLGLISLISWLGWVVWLGAWGVTLFRLEPAVHATT